MNTVSNSALITDHDQNQIRSLGTTSAQIRFMAKALYPDHDYNYYRIAKTLSTVLGRDIRPQHVRNVLVMPLKKQA